MTLRSYVTRLLADIPLDDKFLARALNKYFAVFVIVACFLLIVVLRLLRFLGLFSGFASSNIIPPPPGVVVKDNIAAAARTPTRRSTGRKSVVDSANGDAIADSPTSKRAGSVKKRK